MRISFPLPGRKLGNCTFQRLARYRHYPFCIYPTDALKDFLEAPTLNPLRFPPLSAHSEGTLAKCIRRLWSVRFWRFCSKRSPFLSFAFSVGCCDVFTTFDFVFDCFNLLFIFRYGLPLF